MKSPKSTIILSINEIYEKSAFTFDLFFIFSSKMQNSYGKWCDHSERNVNISQKWKKVEKVEMYLKQQWNFVSEFVNRTIREDTNQKLLNFFERIFFSKKVEKKLVKVRESVYRKFDLILRKVCFNLFHFWEVLTFLSEWSHHFPYEFWISLEKMKKR